MRIHRSVRDDAPKPSRRALLGFAGTGIAAAGVAASVGIGHAQRSSATAADRATAATAEAAEAAAAAAEPALPIPQVDEIARMGPHGCEGMAFDAEGRLFMSNTQGTEILLIGQDGQVSEWTTELQAPNGHKVRGDGTHLVAQMGPPGA